MLSGRDIQAFMLKYLFILKKCRSDSLLKERKAVSQNGTLFLILSLLRVFLEPIKEGGQSLKPSSRTGVGAL